MFRSFIRAMSVSMLIVGTMIGAGFASGREVVAFFGEVPSPFLALITGALVFVCSALFLFAGRRVRRRDIGEVNGAMFGRLRPVADIFMLFNSVTVLGAMLAGADSLAAEFIDIRPAASLAMGALCAVISVRGIKGVLKANAVLVPVMVVFIAVCCLLATDFPFPTVSAPVAPASAALYVSMNMLLGGSVLTTVSDLSPREIILASAAAAVIIALLLTAIMAALRSSSAAHADMPMLLIALKSGKPMYFVCLPVIAAAIFTTMLSAFKSVYDYALGLIGDKLVSAAAVLAVGSAVGAVGFGSVVDGLYPVIGGIGFAYIAFTALFLVRSRVKARIKSGVRRRRARRAGRRA